MLVTGGRIPGHIHIVVMGLEGADHRAGGAMLPAMVAHHGSAPVAGGRFARLMNHHAIVRRRLREVIGQVLAIRELVVARAGVQGQKSAVIEDEAQGVIVPMLRECAAARKQTIRVLFSSAAAHHHLPHVLEVPRLGQGSGAKRSGVSPIRSKERDRQTSSKNSPGSGAGPGHGGPAPPPGEPSDRKGAGCWPGGCRVVESANDSRYAVCRHNQTPAVPAPRRSTATGRNWPARHCAANPARGSVRCWRATC